MSIKTRSHEIAAVLRTEILRNQYRPGERLPSERDLAARFNTNRGAIREALKQLEQLGIITIQPGGVRVLPKEEATLEILDHLLSLDGYPNPKLMDDYLQVFKMICVMSAAQTVERANDEQRSFILNTITNMKNDPADHELIREGWTTLFDYFLTITDNLVMRLIANGLGVQFLSQKKDMPNEPPIDEKVMRKILNGMIRALKNNDAKLMGDIVSQYFDWVRIVFADILASYQAPTKQAVGT